MQRKILVPITIPVIVVGGLLCAACLFSVWYIHRVEVKQADIMAKNVASLQAAQKLEIVLRQLRFHSFVYLADPTPGRLGRIEEDHENFESKWTEARDAAQTEEQQECVSEIRRGFDRYRDEMTQVRKEVSPGRPVPNFARLADSHPINYAVEPCNELLKLNKRALDESSLENDRAGRLARTVVLVVGVLGPLSGIGFGLGIARAVSRSMLQLSVRVRDIAQRLDQDLGSVAIVADGNYAGLDRQLQHVLQRMEEVTGRMQQHQREMLRAEQLASVGQMAASVAHEVRNPLTAVKMLVELAVRPRDPKPLTAEDLQVIHNEVTRLERTVQGLLDFARVPTPQRASCDLRDAVGQSAELLRGRARQQQVEITVRCPRERVSAFVDDDQLRTVFVNLGMNALDAMPQGGRLEIALTAGPDGIRVRLTDTGPGIAADIAPRLFTPFASTKPTGTGLGLSISRRIIEEHGGELTAANRPEGGACFTIQLPSDERSGATIPAAQAG